MAQKKKGFRKKEKVAPEVRTQQLLESFRRAVTGESLANWPAIIEGLAEKGIPESEISPRSNVFTYDIWKHILGRQVRKGEKGVQIVSWVPVTKKTGERTEAGDDEKVGFKRCLGVTVFHVSQTDAIPGFVSILNRADQDALEAAENGGARELTEDDEEALGAAA